MLIDLVANRFLQPDSACIFAFSRGNQAINEQLKIVNFRPLHIPHIRNHFPLETLKSIHL